MRETLITCSKLGLAPRFCGFRFHINPGMRFGPRGPFFLFVTRPKCAHFRQCFGVLLRFLQPW